MGGQSGKKNRYKGEDEMIAIIIAVLCTAFLLYVAIGLVTMGWLLGNAEAHGYDLLTYRMHISAMFAFMFWPWFWRMSRKSEQDYYHEYNI